MTVLFSPAVCSVLLRRGRGGSEGPRPAGQAGYEGSVGQTLGLPVKLRLLGLSLSLQLLGGQLLLLRVVVSEVVNHDGNGQSHHQDTTDGTQRAYQLP